MALVDAMEWGDTRAKLYATFSVTDAPTANPTFHWGDAHFYATNVHGGASVSAVVSEWGVLPDLISSGRSSTGTRTSIRLLANEISIPSNGTMRKTVGVWARILQLRGVPISIYQWEASASDQALLWTGYIIGIGDAPFDGGVPEIDLLLSAELPSIEATPISDIVDRTAFASAPQESVGSMIPRVYGSFTDSVFSAGSRNDKGYLGYPMPGIGGVIVDENQATAKVTIRFAKNDGTDGWFLFTAHGGGAHPAAGDLWVYEPGLNVYGLVSGASYSAVNDANKLDVTVDRSPKVWFFLRPSEVGTSNAAGFTHMNRLMDSDATNSEDSTTTDYIWSLFVPAASLNGNIVDIRTIVDCQNTNAASRTVRFGLYNSYTGAYLSPGADTDLTLPGLGSRTVQIGTSALYTRSDFGARGAEFKSGRFLQTNAGGTLDRPVEILAQVISAGKDGVRMYGMAAAVLVEYPWVPLDNVQDWWSGQGEIDEPSGSNRYSEYYDLKYIYKQRLEQRTSLGRRIEAITRIKGTQFFVRGSAQKDDSSGTYTGAAGGGIAKPSDIAHHLIKKVRGKTVNETAGTLGNFIDPRNWGVTQYLTTLAKFGPDSLELRDALKILESKYPVRFHEEDGVWQLIPDDMNPHSSRFYRSSSNLVDITAGDIEEGSFRCPQTPWEEIVNKVTFSYSHGFPNREAGSSFVYNNPVSQAFFGVRNAPPAEEPWIGANSDDASVENSASGQVARWIGRRSAWPRLYPSFRLRQKFYDLKKGHVVRLRDLEDHGVPFTAYRGGLLLQHYQSASDTVSEHDGGAYIAASGSSEMYVGLGSQSSQLDYDVSVVAGYTAVGSPWQYFATPGSWTALAGVVNPEALKSTGKQTVSFTRPSPWVWAKTELTIGGVLRGPCYWLRMVYNTATATGTSASRTTYPVEWYGRLFEVLEATRIPAGSSRDYDRIQVRLAEVM